ncbi:unnamed protein product [Peronospora belbahrii]|uniref:Uncharacterized protein n=1 Tax=Peronospora belbahrii TaxID=622444 RepID=A0ABN8CJL7_9STRA|nr:unnamed protein product [Peronospora belbahrii]
MTIDDVTGCAIKSIVDTGNIYATDRCRMHCALAFISRMQLVSFSTWAMREYACYILNGLFLVINFTPIRKNVAEDV